MVVTDILSQALQQKSQDITNAMHLISTTKSLIQSVREDGWDSLLENVRLFCARYEIDFPNMGAPYLAGRGRSCQQKDHITIEHHYRVEVFMVTLDSQLQELNSIFNEQAMELLALSFVLVPKDGFRSFYANKICKLGSKFYPDDFS